jgi:hypothetical protein
MGLKYAHIYTHCIKDLSLKQIYEIASHRMNNNVSNGTRQPTIDVDCSWVVRSKPNICNSVDTNTMYIVSFAQALSSIGFSVMLVFDGSQRHHSKRATIQRRAECHRNKIELILKKVDLINATEDCRHSQSVEERSTLEKEQHDLKRQITTLENAVQRNLIDVGDDLFL